MNNKQAKTVEICKCKSRKPHPYEILSEYCVECGKIWIGTLMGSFRPTDRFYHVSKKIIFNSCNVFIIYKYGFCCRLFNNSWRLHNV